MTTTPVKVKFLESEPGVQSNSRLQANIMIGYAIISSLIILIFGCFLLWGQDKSFLNLLTLAGAASGNFLTIATPAMYFIFNQKKSETENYKAELLKSVEIAKINSPVSDASLTDQQQTQ
jgi:hypothetical protein